MTAVRVTSLRRRDWGRAENYFPPAQTYLNRVVPMYVQPELEFDFPDTVRPIRPQLQVVPAIKSPTPVAVPDSDDYFDPQRTADDQLPDPKRWAIKITQAMLEVRAGRRPIHQLTRWASHPVLLSLGTANRQGQHRLATQPGRLSSLRVDRPASGIAEIAAVVTTSERSRAIAIRLEGWDGRWVCTEFCVI
jgi:hypothetical protein